MSVPAIPNCFDIAGDLLFIHFLYIWTSLATLENHNPWIQHDIHDSTSIGGHHGSLDKVPKLHAAKATGQVSLVHSIHAIQNAISVAGKKGGSVLKNTTKKYKTVSIRGVRGTI